MNGVDKLSVNRFTLFFINGFIQQVSINSRLNFFSRRWRGGNFAFRQSLTKLFFNQRGELFGAFFKLFDRVVSGGNHALNFGRILAVFDNLSGSFDSSVHIFNTLKHFSNFRILSNHLLSCRFQSLRLTLRLSFRIQGLFRFRQDRQTSAEKFDSRVDAGNLSVQTHDFAFQTVDGLQL